MIVMNVNLPPISVTTPNIVVTPVSGIALTTSFNIVVKNLVEEDITLSYKFNYYYDQNSYNAEIISGNQINNIHTLQDFTTSTQLDTILPRGTLNAGVYNILIMIQAKDALGAI